MTRSRPVIAVLGAAGQPAGGLVHAIRADPACSFSVREVTGDVADVAGLEAALRGAHGVFLSCGTLDRGTAGLDACATDHVARAARAAAVRHVVCALAPGQVDPAPESLRELPTTFLQPASLWEDVVRRDAALQRGVDGVLDLALPTGRRPFAGIAAQDVGGCALGVFQRCGQHVGATLGIVGDRLHACEMAAALTIALGEAVRSRPTPCDDPSGPEHGIEQARELHPQLMDFAQWLAAEASRLRATLRRDQPGPTAGLGSGLTVSCTLPALGTSIGTRAR